MYSPTAPCPPPATGVTCSGCGWIEGGGGRECRSCGAVLPDRPLQHSYAGAPFATRHSPPKPAPAKPVQKTSTSLFSIRSSLTLTLFAVAGWWQWLHIKPVVQVPGILAPDTPLQTSTPVGLAAWPVGDAQIIPLASFWSKARILHLERYRFDEMSVVSPMDVAIGWGPMSDEANVSRMAFSNSGRNLEWHSDDPSFPFWEAPQHLANIHVIPSSDFVKNRLLELQEGSIVLLSGYLVMVKPASGAPWTSSLTRTDSGVDSPEILWLDNISDAP